MSITEARDGQPPPGDAIAFSLVVPFHNSAETERAALLDALANSIPDRRDLEVIWVDDHSPRPWCCSRAFARTTTRLVPNRRDRRYAGTARNTGMEEAAGEWILFADSDDLFDTFALDSVLDHVGAHQHGETDLWVFPTRSFQDRTGGPGRRHEYGNRIVDAARRAGDPALLSRWYAPYGRVIRHAHIRRCGLGFGHTRVANDALFAVDLALSDPRVGYLDWPAYCIRQGNPSLTSQVGDATIAERFAVWREIYDRLDAAGRPDLKDPLLYRIMALWPRNRAAVGSEVIRSLRRRDPILPPARRVPAAVMRRLATRLLGRG